MKFTSSRILNKKPGVMGLDIWDLTGLGYLLIFTFRGLESVGLEIFAFLLTIFVAFFLIRIRLMGRAKSIRDYFSYQWKRLL